MCTRRTALRVTLPSWAENNQWENMTISVYQGRPGCGKSLAMKDNIISQRGLHVFAAPHFKGIAEAVKDLQDKAEAAKLKNFTIIEIHSKSKCRNKGRCETRVADFVAKIDPSKHVALVISHATLMTMDLSIFENGGWTLHMDERPANAVMSGVINARVSWPTYAHLFRLEPIEGNDTESRLIANPEIDLYDVMADRHISDTERNMFSRACSPCPLIIEARSWDDVRDRACPWYSVWTLEALRPFKRVELASSDLLQSLAYRMAPVPVDVKPVAFEPSKARIRIMYYDTVGGTASSSFWETAQGAHNLDLIAAHWASVGVKLWTCNASAETFLQARLGKNAYESPCCEGINNHNKKVGVGMMLSMKAQQHEDVLCRKLTGLTLAEIGETRETSTLYQFAQRAKSRMADCTDDCPIYVYDRQQAERLAAQYRQDRYLDVEIEHVEVKGFQTRTRAPSGAKRKYATPEERAKATREANTKAQAERRAKKKEQTEALAA
jgi:hypothetical protein